MSYFQKAHRPDKKQQKWLSENYKRYSNQQLAEKFKISYAMVSVWLKHCGLKKVQMPDRYHTIKTKRYTKRTPEPESRQIKWLSSEYSNVTREQHIERILSIQL